MILKKEMKDLAIELRRQGKSWNEITNIINDDFNESVKRETIRAYVRRSDIYMPGITKFSMNLTPTENEMKAEGKYVKFGVVSDNHIGCTTTQLTLLHDIYNVFKMNDIDTVYNCGDISDGAEGMHPGDIYERYITGYENNLNEICSVYPNIEGIITYFITGNHDDSWAKRSGCNIGVDISNRRKDMVWLGRDIANVNFSKNCKMQLRHPGNGSAAAISSTSQKIVDTFDIDGSRPNILLVGHYHKLDYVYYKNVHCLQVGTTCSTTPWMRSKNLISHMGGYIVELFLDDAGRCISIRTQPLIYTDIKEEDYKNKKMEVLRNEWRKNNSQQSFN